VSQAYQELVSIGFLTGRRGGRLLVQSPDQPLSQSQRKDLDDLINETMKLARQQGYTLQQIRQRVRERMLEAPPDHLLVVSDQATMRELLRLELTEAQKYPVDTCSTADLAANPALAIGSLILTPPGLMPKTITFLSKSQPAVPILYSEAKEQLQLVR
jgi:DNA-binding GntR family transcriptional regulator